MRRCGWQTTSEEEKCEEFSRRLSVSFQPGKEEVPVGARAAAEGMGRGQENDINWMLASAILIIETREEEAFSARKRSTAFSKTD